MIIIKNDSYDNLSGLVGFDKAIYKASTVAQLNALWHRWSECENLSTEDRFWLEDNSTRKKMEIENPALFCGEHKKLNGVNYDD